MVLGEFDPCEVHLRWVGWLSRFGIETRLALRMATWERSKTHSNWLATRSSFSRDAVTGYAQQCDLIVELPCIGPHSRDMEHTAAIESFDDLCELGTTTAPRLAFFHGSRLLQRDWLQWSSIYRNSGYALASSTLDYAGAMGCAYIPSIVDVGARRAAPYDGKGRPVAITASTDPKLNRTSELGLAAARAGCAVVHIKDADHRECLNRKALGHIGIDQIRGTFAINTLENMALGLANVVDVPIDQRHLLHATLGIKWPATYPRMTSPQDVYDYLKWLIDSPMRLGAQQLQSRRWFSDWWRPEVIAAHVARQIRRILGAQDRTPP